MGPRHTGNAPKAKKLDRYFLPPYKGSLKLQINVHPTLGPFYMPKSRRCSLMNSREKMVSLK